MRFLRDRERHRPWKSEQHFRRNLAWLLGFLFLLALPWYGKARSYWTFGVNLPLSVSWLAVHPAGMSAALDLLAGGGMGVHELRDRIGTPFGVESKPWSLGSSDPEDPTFSGWFLYDRNLRVEFSQGRYVGTQRE